MMPPALVLPILETDPQHHLLLGKWKRKVPGGARVLSHHGLAAVN